MAKTITISRAGHLIGASGIPETVRALAQSIAKINVTGPFTDLTDNSGGSATLNTINPTSDPVDIAVSGSNLASISDVTAGLTAIRNALATLYGQVNAVAVACGFAPVTYTGGGTATGTTVPAIPSTVGGAGVSAPAASTIPVLAAYDTAIYGLAILINRICEATGDTPIKINLVNGPTPLVTSVSSLFVSPGAAGNTGDPGIAQAAMQTVLLIFKTNVAVLAAGLNRAIGPGAIRVIAVR